MNKIILLCTLFFLSSCDPAAFQKMLDQVASTELTSQEIAKGLKEALSAGVEKGVQNLSKQDGFYKTAYKILLPDEAQTLVDKLSIVPGFSQVEEIIIEKINRSAEDAVKRASPIFANAITSMSFNDAMGILMGEKNAATQYLHNRTYQNLYNEFKPEIVTSLNKFGALDYWTDAVNAYNKIPFVKKMNPELEDYVATKSLGSLFNQVEKQELKIRTDINARSTDLLKRVFAKQDS
jgi:hypothetical protein